MDHMIPAWIDGTLVPLDKLEVHRRGLKHKAVSVFVLHGDAVLLQRRALCKYHTPGLWANTCCTHPHWDESAEACVTRRLQQELGITGLTQDHRGQVEYRADVGGGMIEHEVVEIFVSRVATPPVLQPDPKEVMDTAWMPRETLARAIAENPDSFTPWLRIYLSDHAEQIFDQP
ncbi:isopentenyl-diphosphate Delta-isomerase [Salipiger sp.]|uniref:isopentenyl-diphosphate Delta-isomerase n=1 Tax=Salipiger sp. TaxID=2078585 RepID=UPI003A973E87